MVSKKNRSDAVGRSSFRLLVLLGAILIASTGCMTFYRSPIDQQDRPAISAADPVDIGLSVDVRNIKPPGSVFVDIEQHRLRQALRAEMIDNGVFSDVRVSGGSPEVMVTIRVSNHVTELAAQYLSGLTLGLIPTPVSYLDLSANVQVWIDGEPTDVDMMYQDRMVLWMGVPVLLVGPFAGGGQHYGRYAESLTARIVADLERVKFSSQYVSEFRARQADSVSPDNGPKTRPALPTPSEQREQSPAYPDPRSPELTLISTGTGFAVAPNGVVITNYHVIAGGQEIGLRLDDGTVLPATLVAYDAALDLAILETDGSFASLPISLRSARLGEDVFSIGYPNPLIQGFSPKYTDGAIGALSGIQDDPRVYQISVPVQPGNSGGPLVAEDGTVLGVVVARLDDAAIFDLTGSLPQNVNYAIKSTRVAAFLGENGIAFTTTSIAPESIDDLIGRVERSTVVVMAYGR